MAPRTAEGLMRVAAKVVAAMLLLGCVPAEAGCPAGETAVWGSRIGNSGCTGNTKQFPTSFSPSGASGYPSSVVDGPSLVLACKKICDDMGESCAAIDHVANPFPGKCSTCPTNFQHDPQGVNSDSRYEFTCVNSSAPSSANGSNATSNQTNQSAVPPAASKETAGVGLQNATTAAPRQLRGTTQYAWSRSCVRDGVIGPEERCDPGSVVANSGCDAACGVSVGWTCVGGVGEKSICNRVAKAQCIDEIMPRCGPQGGGFGFDSTGITVTGKGFQPTGDYQARFSLKVNGTVRSFNSTSGSTVRFNVKFSTGVWKSANELRFTAPVFTNVSLGEVSRTAVIGFFAQDEGIPRCHSLHNDTDGVTYAGKRGIRVSDAFYGSEVTWYSNEEFPRERITSSQTTLFDYTLTSRAMLLASNYKRHNVVRIDPTTAIVTDLFDSRSGGLLKPCGLDIGPDGALYVASGGTKQILRYDAVTGLFLGAWVHVRGQPSGIRWHNDYLYVIDTTGQRVWIYHWHRNAVSSRESMFDADAPVGRVAGSFDISMLNEPRDLRLGIPNTALKIYISSSGNNGVFQFHAPSFAAQGAQTKFEGKLTKVPMNKATGFDFSYQATDAGSMFLTGQYAGNNWARFNSTDGTVLQISPRDQFLKSPTALTIYGGTMYIGSLDEVREYDTRTGELVHVTKHPGLGVNYLTTAFQCDFEH